MARPTYPSDHTTVVIKSSVFGKTGLQTSIGLKAMRYIIDDTVYWEMRHVLDDFYGENDLNGTWETSKVVKKQFDGVKHMLEELGFNMWDVVVPSRKAYESKQAFYIAHDVKPTRVQNEWQISTLGLIVWLCVWSYTRQTNADKERARAMQEAFFAALLHPPTWFSDTILRRHSSALEDCNLQSTPGQPCRCVKYLTKDLDTDLAGWRWAEFQTFLVDLLYDNSCASYCALANRIPKEIAFYCDAGVLMKEQADPIKTARQFNGPGGQTSTSRPRV